MPKSSLDYLHCEFQVEEWEGSVDNLAAFPGSNSLLNYTPFNYGFFPNFQPNPLHPQPSTVSQAEAWEGSTDKRTAMNQAMQSISSFREAEAVCPQTCSKHYICTRCALSLSPPSSFLPADSSLPHPPPPSSLPSSLPSSILRGERTNLFPPQRAKRI